ncbi:ferritin-like domain-containing protein [Sorangium sp. So ce341]|uniref:ferritin-like domain-containing protein n=1 Tax=Sorangium sp. So ce341 TaxID=3133302 RepID=UPI003F6263ED
MSPAPPSAPPLPPPGAVEPPLPGTVEPPPPGTVEPPPPGTVEPPPPGTVQRWAWDYVLAADLAHKLEPPPVPSVWEPDPATPRRIARPGRPAELRISARASKSPGPEALRNPARRAQLFHAFMHHELQAAELMAWALLAFPETPRAFRGGLVRIALDEVRHMRLYAAYLAAIGHRFGDFPVRDWFWSRVPAAASPAQFVAVMGMGLEGGNLDHTARFAERFRAIGDDEGAALTERVCAEEIPHVRFGVRWFRRFTQAPGGASPHAPGGASPHAPGGASPHAPGGASPHAPGDFETWVRHIPPPLSPLLMRGEPMNRRDRSRSGLSEPFLDALAAWTERAPGS